MEDVPPRQMALGLPSKIYEEDRAALAWFK